MSIVNSTVTAVGPEVVVLAPETPPRQCARQLILERVEKMAEHEAGTRSGEDIEALHDMRVASRRLREALEIFQFCFLPKTYSRLYGRVRQVTRALGQARNADVVSAYFSELLAQSGELIEQVALQDILRRQAKRQANARAKMQKELDKVRPDSLMIQFEKKFAQPPAGRQRGSRTALQLARKLLAERLREVFARRRAITSEDDANGLHQLRMAVKKLRYALETLDFAAGEHVKENLRFFKKLQTALGELHDRDVFIDIVQRRMNKLQKQSFATHLLDGYQTIMAKIAAQRHGIYLEYVNLFGEAKIQDWRKRVVPPPPVQQKPPMARRLEKPVVTEIIS